MPTDISSVPRPLTLPTHKARHCRNVTVAGRRTSVRMERAIWQGVSDIAEEADLTPNGLCDRIEAARGPHGLTAAIRLFVIEYYRLSTLRARAGDPTPPDVAEALLCLQHAPPNAAGSLAASA